MVNEWTDSGKWDGRKSVKVGNGMGSEWADSGTGSRTGNAGIGISNGRGRETQEQESVTREIGNHRSGKEISFPFPFPYRSRTVPDHFSRPDLYRA